MGTIHLDYCKLETIDREFRHKLFCGFGNSNRLRLFLRFINIFFFVLLDDFVSSSFVVFSFSFSLFFSLFDSFAAKHPLNGCRVTFCSFKRMTDADGDRWKSLFTLDAQSLVCLLIRFCLHASLISLSLSVCVCVRSISVRFQQHERKCYDRPNFIDRVCLIGRHPFTESCSPTHTHTRHTQTVKVTCVWLLSFDRREKPWKLMWAICKKKTGIESHRSSVDTKFHTSDKQTSYTLCWRANQVLFHGGTDRKTTGVGRPV
jgi:hypothetical protein